MRCAMRVTCAMILVMLSAATAPGQEAELDLRWRWVYAPCNFQVNERVDQLIALMERAKQAGYNGALVTDYKWGRFDGRPEHYYRNLERTHQAAERIGIELIPAVMPVGYSGSILMNNPNLAEGIAVRDCPMVVTDGKAVVADAENLLPFGGFEDPAGDKLPGWDWVDGPGLSSFADTKSKHSGRTAIRMQTFRSGNTAGNCRLFRKLALEPWRQYHLSLWIRTQRLGNPGDVRVALLTEKGRSLNFTNLRVKATQPWTEHHVILNPMEHSDVRLYIGIWGGRSGTLWIDDVQLVPTAGINLLRREGCPIRVTSEDGATEYVEGRDFQRWEYPKMGRDPWDGAYRVVHSAPPIAIVQGSRIREDQRLKVSYYHTAIIYDDQVCCCLRHPELFEHLERQVADIRKYFAPKKYFMSHDEIRVAGQCELCSADGKTAGQLLAENVAHCSAIIRKIDPKAEVFVWSDMFDPHHNACDEYYLVGSSLEGSWEGLDKNVRVANWNAGHRVESLGFFASRGHKQIIAAYYDRADWQRDLVAWLDAARKAGGVEGIIYTTWGNNYRDMEAFSKSLARK